MKVGIPMLFLAATASDEYRKPALGMWNHLFPKNSPHTYEKKSFYCGDAAGRPASAGKSKDFSDSDLKFALNIGIPF